MIVISEKQAYDMLRLGGYNMSSDRKKLVVNLWEAQGFVNRMNRKKDIAFVEVCKQSIDKKFDESVLHPFSIIRYKQK